MWVLKLSLIDENGTFSWRNKKFKVKSHAIRTSHSIHNNKEYMSGMILLHGEENNKKQFIDSLKKDKAIKELEVEKDLINFFYIKPLSLAQKREEKLFFNLELIFLKPVYTDENGVEIWEIGSWKREFLEKMLNSAEKNYHGKIISFKSLKLAESDILFFSLYPRLTDKQRQAFLLAFQQGYYEFPRQAELKKLANMSNLSYTTYQFHLRQAEKKLMKSVVYKI
jgi:predicted DNA binding protein